MLLYLNEAYHQEGHFRAVILEPSKEN